MSTDPEELARIKQRQFYEEMAERFTKMADEYSPTNYAANPLPIHGMTVVSVIHGSSRSELTLEAADIADGLSAKPLPIDSTSGRHSLWAETINPSQTPEKYGEDLMWWSKTMKSRRDMKK